MALLNYCAANNENVPEQTLNAWVSRFEELGVPADKICEAIRKAEMSKKYGATKFSDFTDMLIEEGMIFTYAEMHKLLGERVEVVYKMVKHEQAEKERRELEANKETEEDMAKLKKFMEDAEYRRQYVNEEINNVLDRLVTRITNEPEITRFFLDRIIKGERR